VSHRLPYQLLADGVLVAHFVAVVFVVGGLFFIIAGGLRGWPLARSPWFRVAHLGAIAIVVAQSWFGADCPLTTLETWLRTRAGQMGYAGSFIEHWIGRLIYWQAPAWIFSLVYSMFGAVVLAAWWYFPPRKGGPR
jgi:hypothetical protein